MNTTEPTATPGRERAYGDLRTAEGLAEWVPFLFGRMDDNLRNDGHILHMAIVLGMRNPDTGESVSNAPAQIFVVFADSDGAREDFAKAKDAFAEYVHGVIVKTEAVGVAWIFEAWTKRTATPEEIRAFRAGESRSLKDDPERIEAGIIMLEHRGPKRSEMHICPIVRDAEGNPRLDLENRISHTDGVMEGRFVGMIPPSN